MIDLTREREKLGQVEIGDINDPEIQYYHKNYLDHVYAITSEDSNILEYIRYDANGNAQFYTGSGTKVSSSPTGNQLTWNCKRLDPITGTYVYHYRHYHPQLGRWLSRDPIEEKGGVNLYGFVGNDGINGWDYLGMQPCCGGVPYDPGSQGCCEGVIYDLGTQCCNDEEVVPLIQDDFGGKCCENVIDFILIHTHDADANKGKGGHTSITHPEIGTYGNWPGGFNEEVNPRGGAGVITKTLKACPGASKAIKDGIKDRIENDPGYGVGPGGKPNCTECVVDILDGAGHDNGNPWTPDGLDDELD